MKKISVILVLLAFVLGTGGAIASSYMSLTIAYEATVDEDQEPICEPHFIDCRVETSAMPCQVTPGVTLRLSNTPTTCGQELWKTPPTP